MEEVADSPVLESKEDREKELNDSGEWEYRESIMYTSFPEVPINRIRQQEDQDTTLDTTLNSTLDTTTNTTLNTTNTTSPPPTPTSPTPTPTTPTPTPPPQDKEDEEEEDDEWSVSSVSSASSPRLVMMTKLTLLEEEVEELRADKIERLEAEVEALKNENTKLRQLLHIRIMFEEAMADTMAGEKGANPDGGAAQDAQDRTGGAEDSPETVVIPDDAATESKGYGLSWEQFWSYALPLKLRSGVNVRLEDLFREIQQGAYPAEFWHQLLQNRLDLPEEPAPFPFTVETVRPSRISQSRPVSPSGGGGSNSSLALEMETRNRSATLA